MKSELSTQLPHLYKHFTQEEALFKKEFSKVSADKKKTLQQEWVILQNYEKALISQIITFQLNLQTTLSKSTFFSHAPRDTKIPLPKKLSELFKNQADIKAFFDDIKFFTLNLLKRCNAQKSLNYNWKLSRADVLVLTFQLHVCKDEVLASKGLCFQKEPADTEVEHEDKSYENKSYSKEEYEETLEIFESFRKFEQTILQIFTRDDKEEFMRSMTEEILNNSPAKNILNFAYLSNYDRFSFEPYPKQFKQLLHDEVEYYIQEDSGLPDMLVDDILHDKQVDLFLQTYSMRLFKEYKIVVKESLSNNFFDVVSQASSWDKILPIIQLVIVGTKKFRPVFDIGHGHILIHKADQLWTRVRQAHIQYKKELDELETRFAEYEKKIFNFEKNIQAIADAKSFTMAMAQQYDGNGLCDIAVNDDGEFNQEKRIMQFVPKGDITLYLSEKIEKSKGLARTDIRREDFKKAIKFYSNLHINNTPDTIIRKLNENSEDLPKFEDKLDKLEVTIEELEAKGIEEFDESLKKIKEVFIQNIGVRRV